MAIPVEFEEMNGVRTAPKGREGEVLPLPVWTDGNICVSCWQLDEDETDRIAAEGRVWLRVMSGSTQPPVAISAFKPPTPEMPVQSRGCMDGEQSDRHAEDAIALAERFHETYELLAPSHGYETRGDSRVPFDELPASSRSLLVATVGAVVLPAIDLVQSNVAEGALATIRRMEREAIGLESQRDRAMAIIELFEYERGPLEPEIVQLRRQIEEGSP